MSRSRPYPKRSVPSTARAHKVARYYQRVLDDSAPKSKPAEPTQRVFHQSDKREGVVISMEAAVKVIRSGLCADAVASIAEAIPSVDRATLLRTIGIDKTTLRRHVSRKKPLDARVTEGAIRTMELSVLATEAFGTVENAGKWLNKPHPLLDGERPIEYASSQYGLAKVQSMLAAIRFGGPV
jgi:putative toxin-antitoxin system antitoxin component (TIGR02293 family)